MSGIKIDGQTFSVRLTPEPIGGEDGERSFLGQSSEGNNTIVIDGTMPETRQEEVLLHEIIHQVMPDLQEWVVRDIGVRLHGVLRENGLLVDGIVALVSDGEVTPEDIVLLNKKSNKMAQEPVMVGMFRVSETPWDGPVFTPDGDLKVTESVGILNRNAVHLAAAQLQGAHGGAKLRGKRNQSAAREVLKLYQETLHETPPQALVEMTK